jgi:hypothetical protein
MATKDSGGKIPGVPTIGTPTLVSGTAANVVFTAPTYVGKGTISYRATASSGQTATGSSSPIQVTGLTAGSTVTFTVKSISSNGVESAASSSSPSLVMGVAPSAPTSPSASGGNAEATVTFTQGATGTAAAGDVTYRVVSSPGGLQATGVNVTSRTVTGLTNGTAYTFTVRAESVYGNSAYSAASNSVTPVAPPYFPPNFCPPCAPPPYPGNCSYVGITCDGQVSYQYYDCGGCQTCPGVGGYNGAYRDGLCGYVAPPSFGPSFPPPFGPSFGPSFGPAFK